MSGEWVSITGDDDVTRMLDRLIDFDKDIDQVMSEWGEETLYGDLYGIGNYAPPPPNSKYIRTGDLGHGWAVTPARQMKMHFTNNVSYAGYVVGDSDGGRQAWMHQGRWWIAFKRIEGRVPALIEKIDREVTIIAE